MLFFNIQSRYWGRSSYWKEMKGKQWKKDKQMVGSDESLWQNAVPVWVATLWSPSETRATEAGGHIPQALLPAVLFLF